MVDTARTFLTEPVLDLDAMLEDLHNGFEGPPPDSSVDDETGRVDEPERDEPEVDPGGSEPDPIDLGEPADAEVTPAADADLDSLLPPGMVEFGGEVLPQTEVDALLELNRRVKTDAATASRVRAAVLGEGLPYPGGAQPAPDPDALPEWVDPDDQSAVLQYRHTQRIERELEELRQAEAQRQQAFNQQQESQRVTDVRDAFRVSLKEFRDTYPHFDVKQLNGIANRAASMGLLEHPEKVGGTLQGGIVAAMETAMWATPEYRDVALSGATVRSQEQISATRKHKSSALSSSTGSSPRTQSREKTPTTRQEVMAGALDFLRSGVADD